MVQVHFTLDFEGMGTKETQMDEEFHGVLHGIEWIVLCGLPDIVLGPPKEVGLIQKQGSWQAIQLLLGPKLLYRHGGVMDYVLFWIVSSDVVVPQHGLLSLHTKLEGPIGCKLKFLFFPWYGCWMIFKGLWIFVVTTFKSCAKQPLMWVDYK